MIYRFWEYDISMNRSNDTHVLTLLKIMLEYNLKIGMIQLFMIMSFKKGFNIVKDLKKNLVLRIMLYLRVLNMNCFKERWCLNIANCI